MLVGAIAATTVIAIAGRNGQPEHRFNVTVFLGKDVTIQQKADVESALSALHPVDGVQFEDREEAWRKFQETFKDRPDLIASSKAEYLPESFRLVATGEVFDCAALASVARLPGVDETVVAQLPAEGRPGAVVKCP